METYVIKRQNIANILINWDKVWAEQISSLNKAEGSVFEEINFSKIFIRLGAFTAGLITTYDDSIITQTIGSSQQLATRLTAGIRVQSVQVVRFYDVKVIQLVHTLPSDGR